MFVQVWIVTGGKDSNDDLTDSVETLQPGLQTTWTVMTVFPR